jgi:hypothetical protein
VPGAARLVTISPLPGDKSPAAAERPVTITDPATVARIAAVVNALPVEPDAGFMECGPTNGTGMQLTFRAAAGGAALAMASGYQTLCGMVSLVVDAGAERRGDDVPAGDGDRWPALERLHRARRRADHAAADAVLMAGGAS